MPDNIQKKALVIFNPLSGSKNTRKITEELIRARLKEFNYKIDWFLLNNDFERNVAGYNSQNLSLVIAVGGDGTVKVAARFILNNHLDVPLAIVPFGSANILAASLGLPFNVKQAIKMIRPDAKVDKIDVGLINDAYHFLVGFSVGYISRVVTATSANLKHRFGHFGYFFRFFFNKIKIRKLHFFIKTSRGEFSVKGNSLVIFNALNYYGLTPKRKIDWQDGFFNLYVFTNRTLVALIQAFFHMLWYHEPQKHIFYLEDKEFFIRLRRGLRTCQIDGDYLKLTKEIKIKVLSRVLPVILP